MIRSVTLRLLPLVGSNHVFHAGDVLIKKYDAILATGYIVADVDETGNPLCFYPRELRESLRGVSDTESLFDFLKWNAHEIEDWFILPFDAAFNYGPR